MEKFYNKFSEKTFKIMTIIFCALGDISIVAYIYVKLFNKRALIKMMELSPSIDMDLVTPEIFEAFYHFYSQLLPLALFSALIIHSVAYILFWNERKSGVGYVKFLALCGPVFALSCFVDGVTVHPGFAWFFPQMLLYIFVFIGFFYFKMDNKGKNAKVKPQT